MRIWSLHPKYLDRRGLVALWREALLAQAVLRGRTAGYVRHPHVLRFRAQRSPAGVIAVYLEGIHAEAARRGYRFSAARIGRSRAHERLLVTRGQLDFEWEHLLAKLSIRDPILREQLSRIRRPQPHPLFRVCAGDIEPWEKGALHA